MMLRQQWLSCYSLHDRCAKLLLTDLPFNMFVPVFLSDQDLSDSTLLALLLHSVQYSVWLCESLSCLQCQY